MAGAVVEPGLPIKAPDMESEVTDEAGEGWWVRLRWRGGDNETDRGSNQGRHVMQERREWEGDGEGEAQSGDVGHMRGGKQTFLQQ